MNSWAISACSSTSPSHRIVSAHACQCSPKASSPGILFSPATALEAGARTLPKTLFLLMRSTMRQPMKNAKAKMNSMFSTPHYVTLRICFDRVCLILGGRAAGLAPLPLAAMPVTKHAARQTVATRPSSGLRRCCGQISGHGKSQLGPDFARFRPRRPARAA